MSVQGRGRALTPGKRRETTTPSGSRDSSRAAQPSPGLALPTFADKDVLQLRGLLRLLAEGAVQVTDLTEALHGTISGLSSPIGKTRPTRTRGIAGMVYRTVRSGMRGAAWALDAALDKLPIAAGAERPGSRARQDALAALNGVFGDHLQRSGNPLALPMSFQQAGETLALDSNQASTRAAVLKGTREPQPVLLCIHGLCLHDGHWTRAGHDHGAVLAEALGWTPLYLRYNTGRSIAANGVALAGQLETLLQRWPNLQLHVLAHSMGGLVMRSAIHHAEDSQRWTAHLRSVSFLGTPHAGAPLERAGSGIDRLLDISPYSAPFVRLGASRSEGITDLRHGRIAAGPRDTHALPPALAAFAIAGTLGPRVGTLKDRMLGDGLVPVTSALGTHRDFSLAIPPSRRRIVPETGHIELLSSPTVAAHLLEWLTPLSGTTSSEKPSRIRKSR